MTRRHFVLDTGYVLELYGVPGKSDARAKAIVRARFQEAVECGDRIYLPVPVVFEIGNHIAHIPDGNSRRDFAQRLHADVLSGITCALPWIIVPHLDPQALTSLVEAFAKEYATQWIGLTDSSIVTEARRLHAKFRGPRELIHIWTLERALKAREPDHESEPYP